MTWSLQPLSPAHTLSEFDCGHVALSTWLKVHAVGALGQGTRTFVLVADESNLVVGYFSIAPHLLERDEAPRKVGRGAPRRIPAILLAKLALDVSCHGRGLGSELLVRALETIVEAARSAGGKIVVVDAIDDEAAGFYRRHDFEPIPGNDRRLVRKLSTIAAALELPWP